MNLTTLAMIILSIGVIIIGYNTIWTRRLLKMRPLQTAEENRTFFRLCHSLDRWYTASMITLSLANFLLFIRNDYPEAWISLFGWVVPIMWTVWFWKRKNKRTLKEDLALINEIELIEGRYAMQAKTPPMKIDANKN